ncbi:hypothetical protein ACRQ5Q_14505 [Bradyrhizobium sp. PMVTL-01]|uniref:hypothetical protein n=1 Tax=Bradyrhizobium sp. PMVTL-01 TaxID=3434999 RepID=UPI003F716628
MTLQKFLETKYPDLSIGLACKAFAVELGTSRQVIDRYRRFERYPIPEMIVKIENASGGLVTSEDHLPPHLAAQRKVASTRPKRAARR